MLLYFQTSFLLGAVTAFVIAILMVIESGTRPTNRDFFFVTILSAVWSFGFFQMINANSQEGAQFWRWFMESGSILLPVIWLNFVYTFLGSKRSLRVLSVAGAGGLAVWVLNLFDLFHPGIFAVEMSPKLYFNFYPTAGIGYYVFFAYFASIIFYSFLVLYEGMVRANGPRKVQIQFVFFAAITGFMGGGMTFLPTLNILLPPLGVIFFALYPIIIAYAIFKHQLFSLKIIIAEIFTFVLWGLVLLNLSLADNLVEKAFNGLLLVGVSLYGFLLIKGVINEVKSREKMQGLIQKIALANKRLVQLEQQKSEFVSIASHQLRTPLTAIKGYASMAIEGSFGKLESVVLEPLNTIFAASQKLVALVEDLLTVSRIEQGRIKYDWAMVDIKGVMEDAIKDNKDDITERRLSVSVRTEKDGMQYLVWADRQRLKQVFNNIIDNAVKFTPKGFVRVLVSKDESRNWVRVAISDTGIGMDKKALEALFVDPQKRAQMADKGDRAAVVGIGIYIAQQIVKTHKGRIWADSDGVNRGSTFFVELPAYEKGKSEAATAQ